MATGTIGVGARTSTRTSQSLAMRSHSHSAPALGPVVIIVAYITVCILATRSHLPNQLLPAHPHPTQDELRDVCDPGYPAWGKLRGVVTMVTLGSTAGPHVCLFQAL